MKNCMFFYMWATLLCSTTTIAQTGNYLPGHPSIDATMTDIEGNVFNIYEALDQNKTIYLWLLSVNSEVCWNYHQTGALNTFYGLYGPQGENTALVISVGGGNLDFLTGANLNDGNFLDGTDFTFFVGEDNGFPSELSDLSTSLMAAAQLGPISGNRVFRICPDKRVYGMGLAPTLQQLVTSVGSCDMQTGVHNASLMFTEMDTIRNCPSEMRPVNAYLSNNGTTTMTSCDIALMWQGQVQDVYHWEGSLAPLRYDTLHLVGNLLTDGTDGMAQIAIQNVNGVPDDEHSNDTLSVFLKGAPPISSEEIRVEILTDGYGDALFWHIADENGVPIDSGGTYEAVDPSYYQPESEYEDYQMYFDTVSLVGHGSSCLTIWVVDRFWNGLCCTFGNGYIRFLSSDDTLFEWSVFKREAFGQVSTTFVSTEDVPTLSRLKAYPNPTESDITLSFHLETSAAVAVEVYNSVGQQVYQAQQSYTSGAQQHTLQTSSWPVGLYFATLRDAAGGVQSVRFVVAR